MDTKLSHPVPHPTNSWGDQPPSNMLPYQYQTLLESEIRVLVLLPGEDDDPVRCYLDHVSFPSKPLYETISYAWGDPSLVTTIACEEKTIQVTVNLHSALQHIRYPHDTRTIWADAVCINQQDIPERSAQVSIMGDIYANSQRVIIWLGEEKESTSKSIDEFEKLNAFFVETEEGYPNQPDRWDMNHIGGSSQHYMRIREMQNEWESPLASLTSIQWFVRRWVIQEVAKSPTAIVVLGKRQISWSVMAEVVWSLKKAAALNLFALRENAEECLDGLQSIMLMELVRRDVLKSNGSRLLELLISTRRYRCFDKRDVFYSQLGVVCDLDSYNQLAPPGSDPETEALWTKLTLSPDYTSSTEESYHRFVLIHIIKKKSLLPLSAAYIPPEKPELDLPSWVPDFSNLNRANPLMFLRNEPALPFKASKGSQLEARFSNDFKTLHIKGRIIDVIDETALPHDKISLTPEWEEQSKAENWDTLKIANKKMRLWHRESLRLFKPVTGDSRINGLLPADFEIYSRTLACNLTGTGDIPPAEFGDMVHEYLGVLIDPETAIKKHVRPLTQENVDIFTDRLVQVEGALGLRVDGWCFAVTEGLMFGRVLSSAKKGDKVVLLGGGEVPYILRKRDEGGWTFISSCYMHGLMDGEGMLRDDLVDEEFDIY